MLPIGGIYEVLTNMFPIGGIYEVLTNMFPIGNIFNMKRIQKVKDVGLLVKNKRKQKKLTQQELAEICGVGRRFISDLELSKKERFDLNLTLRVLQRLGFDIKVHDKEEDGKS